MKKILKDKIENYDYSFNELVTRCKRIIKKNFRTYKTLKLIKNNITLLKIILITIKII